MAQANEWCVRLHDMAGAEVYVGARVDLSRAPIGALGGAVTVGALGADALGLRWEHDAPVVLRAGDVVTIDSLAEHRATVKFDETLADVRARPREPAAGESPPPAPKAPRKKRAKAVAT